MKLFSVPYRWLPRTFLSNLSHIWYDLSYGVRNVLRWIPVIWFDRDWDWSYLASIMEYKLRRSARLELTVGHHVTSKNDGRQMLICAELLKRLQKDEYFKTLNKPFGQSRDRVKLSIKQAKADQALLGKILGKHLTSWWD